MELSKAFDTIDHNILLHKLKYYGLNSAAVDLCRSYLLKRKQYVKIGVPQRSILGPRLFVIYINDIALSSDPFECIIYADDTTRNSAKTKLIKYHMPHKKVKVPFLQINGANIGCVNYSNGCLYARPPLIDYNFFRDKEH